LPSPIEKYFSFEVFGKLGYVTIDGKGGSYGDEVLTLGRRKTFWRSILRFINSR
jgi:hypothetical protein